MKRAAVVMGLVVVSAAAPGCEEACTLEAVSSVNVTVIDADGELVNDIVASYRVNGGPERQGECWPEGCGRFSAGADQSGTFEITVTSTAGSATETRVVEVEDGDCHVISQDVRIVLSPGSTTAPTADEACAGYCAKVAQCDAPDPACESSCVADINDADDRVDPDSCRRTRAIAIECLGSATCEQLVLDKDDPANPCRNQLAAIDCASPTS